MQYCELSIVAVQALQIVFLRRSYAVEGQVRKKKDLYDPKYHTY